MIDPDGALDGLTEMRATVTENFTWLYIGTQPLWIFFLLYIYVAYGKQKLGTADDEPEFGSLTYFAMILSAGVAVGLFFFGVSERLYHKAQTRQDDGIICVGKLRLGGDHDGHLYLSRRPAPVHEKLILRFSWRLCLGMDR